MAITAKNYFPLSSTVQKNDQIPEHFETNPYGP